MITLSPLHQGSALYAEHGKKIDQNKDPCFLNNNNKKYVKAKFFSHGKVSKKKKTNLYHFSKFERYKEREISFIVM